MPDHLAAASRQSGAATAGGRALVARAVRGTLVDRRGTNNLRLRYPAFGTARSTGCNPRIAARGRRRCAHASPQPPRLAGCADGDSYQHAAASRRLRLVSERRALLAPLAALARAVPGSTVGANPANCGALHVQTG